MAIRGLPTCAYLHRDGDGKDSILVDLMRGLEARPDDPELVLRLINKRIQMGDWEIAASFLEYAHTLEHADSSMLDRLGLEIIQLKAGSPKSHDKE